MVIRKYRDQTPRLGENVYIDPAATVIGDVVLGHNVSIWPGAIVRGDVNEIRIGDNSNVQDGSVLHVTHAGPFTTPTGFGLYIGQGVTVGHKAILHGCKIGDYCLIGMGAIIMDGAEVGDETLIAAGALVTPGTQVTAGTLWRGSPAREARALTTREREQLRYSADHYVRLKNDYMAV